MSQKFGTIQYSMEYMCYSSYCMYTVPCHVSNMNTVDIVNKIALICNLISPSPFCLMYSMQVWVFQYRTNHA